MINKNVCVRESTNPIRPKKIWIAKNTPNLIDVVCRPSPRHRGRWYLGGECIEAQRINRQETPILEIAHGLVTSPLENFISSEIYGCIGLVSFFL